MHYNLANANKNTLKKKSNASLSLKIGLENVEELFDSPFISTDKTKSLAKYSSDTTKRFGKKTKLRISFQDNLERRQN